MLNTSTLTELLILIQYQTKSPKEVVYREQLPDLISEGSHKRSSLTDASGTLISNKHGR